MSYYNKYNFVSAEPTYAIVKEELKSYFDTGAVDDLLFPTYLNKCLDKLGKATHAIVPVILLNMNDKEAFDYFIKTWKHFFRRRLRLFL